MTRVEVIKTWKLKKNNNKQEFKEIVNNYYLLLHETANEKQEKIKNILMTPAEEACEVCGQKKVGQGT